MANEAGTSDDLQSQLETLRDNTANLIEEETRLQQRLDQIRTNIADNNKDMSTMADALLNQLVTTQRAHAQSTFWAHVNSSDVLVRGLWDQMSQDAELKAAIVAIAQKSSNEDQQKHLLIALLNEISGDPGKLLEVVAGRVLQFDGKKNGHVDNPILLDGLDGIVGHDASRESSLFLPATSPTVKSESGAVIPVDPAILDSLNSGSPLTRPTQTPQKNSTSSLERNYPDLFAAVNKNDLAPLAKVPAQDSNPGKRGRTVSDDSLFCSPISGTAAKKFKSGKEIVFASSLVTLLQTLQSTHRSGQSIADMIRCSKCHTVKRDSRVLGCTHVYCHRCTQKLRIEAERGDAVHGFRAFCVQPNCNETVAGKTAVIFPEVIELLVWYDKQPPNVTSREAQLVMLNNAKERKPADGTIKNLLAEFLKRKTEAAMAGEQSMICDLVEMATFARKWLVSERA